MKLKTITIIADRQFDTLPEFQIGRPPTGIKGLATWNMG
jgi:hypothetical protein